MIYCVSDSLTAPPHPLDPITFHLKIGRPGVIAVNFSVTPRPRIVYWQLANGTKLYVEPFIEPVSNYTPYQIFQLKTLVLLSISVLKLFSFIYLFYFQ